MKTEPNESMHPITDNVLTCDKGLTKREYFAAMAMQGICANTSRYEPDRLANYAVRIADYLIEELNKQP